MDALTEKLYWNFYRNHFAEITPQLYRMKIATANTRDPNIERKCRGNRCANFETDELI